MPDMRNCMSEPKCKKDICIDALRILDSCKDKDCFEDTPVLLTDFGQVSIKMAKEQNLSLNSAKISGICGRLMCCLRYEHEVYEYEIKRTPPVDSTVKTPDGIGTVTEINPLQATLKVRLADKPDTQPKLYRRSEVTLISK